MAEALRDPNHVTTMLCYNETTGLTEPARVDPVTGDLLIFGVPMGASTPATINILDRDPNHVTVKGAYNETTGLVEPVRSDTSGNLLVKSV